MTPNEADDLKTKCIESVNDNINISTFDSNTISTFTITFFQHKIQFVIIGCVTVLLCVEFWSFMFYKKKKEIMVNKNSKKVKIIKKKVIKI